MKNVLVTGAKGQLGKCIRDISKEYTHLHFLFTSKNELDIEDQDSVEEFFKYSNIDYCINAAAYTNVEKAESEPNKAFKVNAEAVKNIAVACNRYRSVIIHISTDYVFDGKKKTPYRETDEINPLNVYGTSKLKGEEYIKEICDEYFIIRTSWLYSQYGHNFFKTILNKSKEKELLKITTKQTGTPTNANDLVKETIKIITNESTEYGLFHFSNSGEATWYDFAKTILQESKQIHQTKLEKTNHYRTFAARPEYSVLDINKFCNTFNIKPRKWAESVQSLINRYNY